MIFILMIFGITEKCIILSHTMYITTNIAVLLMTASVLQGHTHYIAKSIGTPSNERFKYFSNLHEYKS